MWGSLPNMATETSTEFTRLLKIAHANVVNLYASAHRAHWNVRGYNFSQYHAFFQEIYEDIYGSIDPFAENIRKMKSFPLTLTEMVSVASIKDDTKSTDCEELAKDLYQKNMMFIGMLKNLFNVATEADEQGIANFIAERIDQHHKWDWQLSASIA
jgi:starvation-inducible DNA-binding protein